ISVKYDNRDTHKPGYKFNEWESKGVPVRITVGPRDVQNNQVELARRDTKEKSSIATENIISTVLNLMIEIQENLYQRSVSFRDDHISEVNSYEEFKSVLETKTGFISAHWDGTPET